MWFITYNNKNIINRHGSCMTHSAIGMNQETDFFSAISIMSYLHMGSKLRVRQKVGKSVESWATEVGYNWRCWDFLWT